MSYLGKTSRSPWLGPALFCSLLILSCSSTPLPGNNSVTVPEDFFGMVHAGITRTPEEYGLLDKLGVQWVSNTFYWGGIEWEQGVFDFSGYDAFVDTAREEGRKIVAVLGYEAPWLYPEGKQKKYIAPKDIPLFLRFVEETVKHFRGRVDVWEIWNEPNFMFWKGSDREFFELSRLTALKIRETDPGAYILGGAFWRAPRRFILNMHKARGMENLDGLAFHPYAVNPSSSMKIYDKFQKVLGEINYSRPLWITEIGYPTAGWYPTTVAPEELPSYVVKTITGAAARGARALFWYQLFDSHNEGEVPLNTRDSEKFFGLVYPDYQSKDGARAFELCARFLPGSRYMKEFPLRENIPSSVVSFCFLKAPPENNSLIIWNDRKGIQRVNLYLAAPALLYDISTGLSRPLTGEISLDVGNRPLFITWQGTDIPRLSKPEK